MELSVVMPAYNEDVAIRRALGEVFRHVAAHVPSIEVVVVDDGSRDGTGATLDAMAAADPRLRVIHQPNAGHGPALVRGLAAAQGDALLLLDADDQIALDDFPSHWAAFRAAGALLGVRSQRQDGRVRAAISAALRGAIVLLFGRAPRDANVPFKIVRAEDWRAASVLIGEDCLIPSALLAIHLVLADRPPAEGAVVHRPRVGSISTLRAGKLARFCLKAAKALIAYRLARFGRRRLEARPKAGS